MKIYETFEEAFVSTIKELIINPEIIDESRNGAMYEKLGMSFKVLRPETYQFTNENFGRISYEYANDFYEWMTSPDDQASTTFSDKYPHVAGFLAKPKSKNLPENFNALYGPRILRQLPVILNELKNVKNSRRCVISILNEDDLQLLDAKDDPNLEFPCCNSATFNVRNGKLYMNLHMRSNNMGNVAKLDMYLWGRLMEHIKNELNVEFGHVTYTIVSAHIFTTDFNYFLKSGMFNEQYNENSNKSTVEVLKAYIKRSIHELRSNNNNIAVIRHFKTLNNVKRIYQGGHVTKDESILLSMIDPTQLHKLDMLAGAITKIYTSEYRRSKETAEYLLNHFDINPEKTESKFLNEFNLGEIDGCKMLNEHEMSTFLNKFDSISLHETFSKNGQTVYELFVAIYNFLQELNHHNDQVILVVGHGNWVSALQILLGLSNKFSENRLHNGETLYIC